jgi:PAS domain S-box-containing protein
MTAGVGQPAPSKSQRTAIMPLSDPVVIVVVGFDETQRTAMLDVLEHGQFTAAGFANAEQALTALGQTAPGLFVTSLSAPELEGWRLCRMLRSGAQASFQQVPVLLVCNGLAEDEAARITAELGGNGVLPLASANDLLLDRVKELTAAGAVADKTVLEALRSSEEKFSTAFLHAPMPMAISEIEEGIFLDVNEKFEELSGYSRQEAIGKTSVELGWMSAEDRARMLEQIHAKGLVSRMELSFRARNGDRMDVLHHGEVIYVGGIPRILSIGEDVTERKRYEAEREANLSLLRLLDASTGRDNMVREVTKFLQEWSGCEAVGIRLKDGDDFPSEFIREENFLIPLRTGRQVLGLLQFDGKGASRFTPGMIAFLERAAANLAIAIEQRTTQAALQESERRHRLISENTGDIIWTLDIASKRLTYISRSVERLLGRSVEEALALPTAEVLTPESYAGMEATFPGRAAALASGDESARVRTDRLKLRRKDGTLLSTEVVNTLITDDEGQVREILGVTRDITERLRAEEERTRLEEQLRQAQKLESVGRLAGGVAHDFNNLLTVINGYSDLLMARLSVGDPLRDSLNEIRKAGTKASALTQQLLAFSRKQVIQPRPLNLNQLITETRDMLQRMVGEDVELVAKLDPALGQVMADHGQFHQVLMNLVVNARDAMPGGGRLLIETANVELDQPYAATHPETTPGAHVMLAVTDTGVGMDEATRHQIFEPFFTTKGEGKGTGLGLSTVYGIVRQCGGSIWVYSELGHGATFKIYLPRLKSPAGIQEHSVKAHLSLRGSETVLVVEDQDDVRSLTVEVLRSHGYRILEAPTGGDALLLVERNPGPIHLMLTDVVMPRMTGRELAERLRPQRPQMQVLYMSGYTENAITQHGALDPGVNYLSKPFTPNELAMKVREVLGPPRPAGSILVVGEETGIRHLFQQVLAGAGYQVTLASGWAEALELARERAFDVLLADLGGPDGRGVETVRQFREQRPSLKVIGVSAPFGGSLRTATERLGTDATLVKPVTPDQLLNTIRRMME